MPRHLPIDDVIAVLARGASVEQFLGLREDDTSAKVIWVEIRPVHDGFETHRFDVTDYGAPDRLDLSAWIDGDAEQESFHFETPKDAIESAMKDWGADPRKWVNQGVLQDEYRDAILKRSEIEN
ncbi:MAG: hypothetical protein ACTHOH_12545 [Lysobacteraceae bacterium]